MSFYATDAEEFAAEQRTYGSQAGYNLAIRDVVLAMNTKADEAQFFVERTLWREAAQIAESFAGTKVDA